MGAGVGVEGAEGARVFVDGVEVCVVLLEDYFAEGLFLGGAGGGLLVGVVEILVWRGRVDVWWEAWKERGMGWW